MTVLIAHAGSCRLSVSTAGDLILKCGAGPRRVLVYSTGGWPDRDHLQCVTDLDAESVVDKFLSIAPHDLTKPELVKEVNDALNKCENPNADPIPSH